MRRRSRSSCPTRGSAGGSGSGSWGADIIPDRLRSLPDGSQAGAALATRHASVAINLSSLTPRRLFARSALRGTDGRQELVAGPIRGELLGADHLAERARVAAREQKLAPLGRGRGETPLLARLSATRLILADAHERLTAAANDDRDVGPAGEWLLDNYHVVQEHIREVRESLPGGYYRELPELVTGPLAGYPRILVHAITLFSQHKARIILQYVNLFISLDTRFNTLMILYH